MEFSIFKDDSCQPAPDKTKLILAKLSNSQFESPLGKKLSKLLKQKQQAEVTVVGVFADPGRFIGHQACCRYKLEVQQLLSVEELKAKAGNADTVDPAECPTHSRSVRMSGKYLIIAIPLNF